MSPRTQQQFEEIREEKRTLIMDSALEHFANEGFYATTINHIAKHAGISKGLMYNYFESKEALLDSIIKRSVVEYYKYFDTDDDGFLTEDEFKFFIKKLSILIKEHQSSLRLVFRLLIQNEVQEQFTRSFLITDSPELDQMLKKETAGLFFSGRINTIVNYFVRKKDRKGPDYDPYLDLKMFLITLKGFLMTYIYLEPGDDNSYEEIVNRIIEEFK